jgi:hypothetical protein
VVLGIIEFRCGGFVAMAGALAIGAAILVELFFSLAMTFEDASFEPEGFTLDTGCIFSAAAFFATGFFAGVADFFTGFATAFFAAFALEGFAALFSADFFADALAGLAEFDFFAFAIGYFDFLS